MQLGENVYQYRSSKDPKFEPETHPISSSSLTNCISTAQKAPFRRPQKRRKEKLQFDFKQITISNCSLIIHLLSTFTHEKTKFIYYVLRHCFLNSNYILLSTYYSTSSYDKNKFYILMTSALFSSLSN